MLLSCCPAVLLAGRVRGSGIAAAALLHSALDLLHHDDGCTHFWPLTD